MTTLTRPIAGEVCDVRGLLNDCLQLWNLDARVVVDGNTFRIGDITVEPASEDMRPARWFLHTPQRRRAIPSIVALLSALRSALDGEGGNTLRIGAAS